MKAILLSIYLFVFMSQTTHAQLWEHYYGKPDYMDHSTFFNETYDGGYFCGGTSAIVYLTIPYTKLYKLDRNGDTLWTKSLTSNFSNQTNSISNTLDGGIVGAGAIYPEDVSGASKPMAYKLNACGELEWCTYFDTDRELPWAESILATDDGGCLLTLNSFGDYHIENTFLVKLDANGQVMWAKPVINHDTYPDAFNPLSDRMIKTENGDYLISGRVYWENPWDEQILIRPYYALFDAQGEEKWVTPFGVTDSLIGHAYGCIEFENNHFLCAARQYFLGSNLQYGLIIELDGDGNILQHRSIGPEEIADDCYSMFFRYIEQIGDTLVLSMPYLVSSSSYCPAILSIDIDIFNGELDILSLRTFPDKMDYHHINKTSDNKIFSGKRHRVEGYDTDMYITKMDAMLVTDSTFEDNNTYDSLCPYSISYSEVFLGNCNIITDISELIFPVGKENDNKAAFHILPNPGTNVMRLQFEGPVIDMNLDIKVVSMLGNLMLQANIYTKNQEDMDISKLPKGIYLVQVYSNGISLGTQKLIKL
jgi:hypothetical protein